MKSDPWWKAGLLVAALAVLEIAVTPRIGVRGARPECLLMLVLYVGLWGRADLALGVAWSAGFAKDLWSVGPLGAHALLFVGIALALLAVRHYLFLERPFTQVLLALTAHVTCGLGYGMLLAVRQPHAGLRGGGTTVLLGAAYTAALTPIALMLLRRTRKWWRVGALAGLGST